MNRDAELRFIFSEVLKGYSFANIKSKKIYFKHLSSLSLSEVEIAYFKSYENAVAQSIPTEKQKLEFLEKEGLWTKQQDDEIKKLSLFLNGLNKSKSKQALLSQRRIIQTQIDEQSKKLDKLKREKSELIGATAESIADRKRTKEIVLNYSYCDDSFSSNFFDKEDYEDDDLDEGINAFYTISEKFNEKNLKSVSISSDFLLYFLLSKDSAYYFYGKPISQLTFYQAQLFHHGNYFSDVLGKSKDSMPFDIRNDPDKIIEWAEVKENVDTIVKKSGSKDNISVVGATKEDLKFAGLESEQKIDYAAKAREKGGSLGMEDFLALQGD